MLSSIVGVESARQLWSSIEHQLLPVTKEKENHLTDKMLSLNKNTLSLEEYLLEFKCLCESLAAINKPLGD